ncbi:MAG: AMP-binding protein [Phycisphaerales bacterium]|nr:AMP-binding protein [Phycisphaerales bacterium]
MHTHAECLVGMSRDGITETLKEAGRLRLEHNGQQQIVSIHGRIFANLLEADAKKLLPELLLVCCNPNQLGAFTGEVTSFLENSARRGLLDSPEQVRHHMPILLILPNGVLFESTFSEFQSQLNEAILMERLPGVTSEVQAAIEARLVRGISLQAGGRRGSGADTTYLLEKKGSIVFAGGGGFEQERIAAILQAHDYPFTHVPNAPATRIEFDKAMISIVLNVGGLIHMVKPSGECIDLRMGDLCLDQSKDEFVRQITRGVFDVGQANGAYSSDATWEEVWEGHRNIILKNKGHVTSSVKDLSVALNRGLESVRLFTNEEWILEPLQRYAALADMQAERSMFKDLAKQVQQAIARAIKFRRDKGGTGARSRTMKLSAQRNINIDLYEDGDEHLVLVGTFHDSEHLIRLEVAIGVAERQILRSDLNMIRSPFPVCSEVKKTAQLLVGLRVERGVLNEISSRLGGRTGCSHIREIAASIMQFVATYLVRIRAGVRPFDEEFLREPAEDRFRLTRELLQDSCLAYSQLTVHGLDEKVGIRRLGEEHGSPIELGEHEVSIGALIRDRMSRWGDRVCTKYRILDDEHELTWSELGDRVARVGRHLIERDIHPGDRIGIVSENRVEMLILELAIQSIGAVTVPVFAGYPAPLVGYVIRHAKPRMLVVSNMKQLDKIDRNQHDFIESCFCMDASDATRAWGAVDFDSLLADGGAPLLEYESRVNAVGADDRCLVMYTSGTTGPPKGVCLSHRNLISQQKAISLIWDINQEDVMLSFLPWHHSFGGLFERFMALYNGCILGLDDSRGRDMDRLLDNWRRYRPTIFFSVPRVHQSLLNRCRECETCEQSVFHDRLRLVFTAGAPLPAGVEQAYRDYDIQVFEGFGLTETSPCVTVTSPDRKWRSGYVGFPIPGVTIRIDSDQEILVQGPNVMAGYLDDEDATSRVIDDHGWFHTGDLGEFTRDGLRILGRKDGAFKLTTGEKVHPQRVENTLVNESPFIGTAVVIGSGKDFVSTLVFPDFVRLQAWADEQGIHAPVLTDDPTIRELFATEVARINPRIEVKYQRVRRVILAGRDPSLERGELTPSAKIVRQRVFDSFKHEIEELFKSVPSDLVIEIQEQPLAGELAR